MVDYNVPSGLDVNSDWQLFFMKMSVMNCAAIYFSQGGWSEAESILWSSNLHSDFWSDIKPD